MRSSPVRPRRTPPKALLPAKTWGYEEEEPLLVAEVGHGIGMSYEEPVIQPDPGRSQPSADVPDRAW